MKSIYDHLPLLGHSPNFSPPKVLFAKLADIEMFSAILYIIIPTYIEMGDSLVQWIQIDSPLSKNQKLNYYK